MTLEALCPTSSDVLVYDTFNAAAAACAAASAGTFLFGNAPPVEVPPAAAAQANGENSGQQGRRKRRRRQRSTKNAEDAESQRMTHIAVERNRRRQMNEYLAALRSLMPDSYVHRVRDPTRYYSFPNLDRFRCVCGHAFSSSILLVSMGFKFCSGFSS
jgi:hypothetical protein